MWFVKRRMDKNSRIFFTFCSLAVRMLFFFLPTILCTVEHSSLIAHWGNNKSGNNINNHSFCKVCVELLHSITNYKQYIYTVCVYLRKRVEVKGQISRWGSTSPTYTYCSKQWLKVKRVIGYAAWVRSKALSVHMVAVLHQAAEHCWRRGSLTRAGAAEWGVLSQSVSQKKQQMFEDDNIWRSGLVGSFVLLQISDQCILVPQSTEFWSDLTGFSFIGSHL